MSIHVSRQFNPKCEFIEIRNLMYFFKEPPLSERKTRVTIPRWTVVYFKRL